MTAHRALHAPRALLALLLVAAAWPPAAAAGLGYRGGSARCGHSRVGRREPENATQTQCSAIKDCFCIQHTNCGWCASLGKAGVDQNGCTNWVSDPFQCKRLWCPSDQDAVIWFRLRCLVMPGVCFVLLLLAIWFTRCAHTDQEESVNDMLAASAQVTYITGKATTLREVGLQGSFTKAPAAARDFFGTMRTYDAFRLGLACPPEQRLPTQTLRPYNLSVTNLAQDIGDRGCDDAHVPKFRLFVSLRIAFMWRTALFSELVPMCFLMLMSAVFMASVKFSAQMVTQSEYIAIALFIKEAGALVSSLQVTVSVLLSFYALERINWFWSVAQMGFAVQGHAHNIAMLSGPSLGDSEREWRLRYTLYRHLVTCFFFAYQAYTPGLQFLGFAPLVLCGLLTPEEAEAIGQSHSCPRTVLEAWISRWAQTNLKDDATRDVVLASLREYRGALGGVGDLVSMRAPVSFESLLYIAVYALCICIPFGSQYVDFEDRKAIMTGMHIAIPLGDGVLIAFYFSLLHLLRHIQAPFDCIGLPQDCLNPLAILNVTERKLRDYLSASPPEAAPGGAGKD